MPYHITLQQDPVVYMYLCVYRALLLRIVFILSTQSFCIRQEHRVDHRCRCNCHSKRLSARMYSYRDSKGKSKIEKSGLK